MTANHGKVMAPQKDMCKQNERNFWSNSVFLVLLISIRRPQTTLLHSSQGTSRMRAGQWIWVLRQGILCHFRSLWGIFSPPRCTSGSDLINSVKTLQLRVFVLKLLLLSQRGCNLQAASMKSNTAIHMITAACELKSFLIRGLHGQFSMYLNLCWCFTNYASYCLR